MERPIKPPHLLPRCAAEGLDAWSVVCEGVTNRTLYDTTEKRQVNFSLLLSSEAGEVAGLMHKRHFQGREPAPERVLEELGDVLFALTQVASANGFRLADAARAQVEKWNRLFPDGFTEQAAQARDAEPPPICRSTG